MESESASTPVTPNKLIPLLLFGLRDPNSHIHIFARDIDAFRLLLKAISLLNFGVWIEHSVQPKDIKYASWKGNGFAKGMICFPDEVRFPAPLRSEDGSLQEFHVNMMPFEMTNPDLIAAEMLHEPGKYSHSHLENTLPPECKRYAQIIATCLRRCKNEWGKVGYLTIHESLVQEGATQRRPGLHIESPGALTKSPPLKAHAYHRWYCWGGGKLGNGIEGDVDEFGKVNVEGGIFMASNLDDTCRVWDCLVRDHGDVTFALGDIEHMRGAIGEGENMKANQLVWITDRTPHESLRQSKPGFRQFFRLVTSELSAWYQQHNTQNSVGTKPACDIIHGNKFD